MKVSLLDLRRKTSKIVEALDKNQKVTLTRRGKTFAVISPEILNARTIRAKDHSAFGMHIDLRSNEDVLD